mmetsp:Transcript_11390/g.35163  ORF Transcript_11390/g.35163 Transcript_11390/m.35163 type:complete len:279 (+) Transcript_11390:1968-2804(+)
MRGGPLPKADSSPLSTSLEAASVFSALGGSGDALEDPTVEQPREEVREPRRLPPPTISTEPLTRTAHALPREPPEAGVLSALALTSSAAAPSSSSSSESCAPLVFTSVLAAERASASVRSAASPPLVVAPLSPRIVSIRLIEAASAAEVASSSSSPLTAHPTPPSGGIVPSRSTRCKPASATDASAIVFPDKVRLPMPGEKPGSRLCAVVDDSSVSSTSLALSASAEVVSPSSLRDERDERESGGKAVGTPPDSGVPRGVEPSGGKSAGGRLLRSTRW